MGRRLMEILIREGGGRGLLSILLNERNIKFSMYRNDGLLARARKPQVTCSDLLYVSGRNHRKSKNKPVTSYKMSREQ